MTSELSSACNEEAVLGKFKFHNEYRKQIRKKKLVYHQPEEIVGMYQGMNWAMKHGKCSNDANSGDLHKYYQHVYRKAYSTFLLSHQVFKEFTEN